MKPVLLFFAFLPLGWVANQVVATHIMANDWQWDRVKGDTFMLSIIHYVDCNSTAGLEKKLRLSVQVAKEMSLKHGYVNFEAIAEKSYETEATPVCGGGCGDCGECGVDETKMVTWGIRKVVYNLLIDLSDYADQGYSVIALTYHVGSRARSQLTNVQVNNGTSLATYAMFMFGMNVPNQNVRFAYEPIWILPVGYRHQVNPGMWGLDKDKSGNTIESVSINLVNPLTYYVLGKPGHTGYLKYVSPYSYQKPLHHKGFNKSGDSLFYMDSTTGNMSFHVVKEQATQMAHMVREYRNGEVVTEFVREVQVWVLKLPKNQSPVLSCLGGAMHQDFLTGDYTVDICSGQKLDLTLKVQDDDSTKAVKLKILSGVPDGVQATVDNTVPARPTLHLESIGSGAFKGPEIELLLDISDNGCPIVNRTYRRVYIRLGKNNPKEDRLKHTKIAHACGLYHLWLDLSDSIVLDYTKWYINGNKVNVPANRIKNMVFGGKGTQAIEVKYGYGGCVYVSRDTIKSAPTKFIAAKDILRDTALCDNDGFALNLPKDKLGHSHWFYKGVEVTGIKIKDFPAGKHEFRYLDTSGTACVLDTFGLEVKASPNLVAWASTDTTCLKHEPINLLSNDSHTVWTGTYVDSASGAYYFNMTKAKAGTYSSLATLQRNGCKSEKYVPITVDAIGFSGAWPKKFSYCTSDIDTFLPLKNCAFLRFNDNWQASQFYVKEGKYFLKDNGGKEYGLNVTGTFIDSRYCYEPFDINVLFYPRNQYFGITPTAPICEDSTRRKIVFDWTPNYWYPRKAVNIINASTVYLNIPALGAGEHTITARLRNDYCTYVEVVKVNVLDTIQFNFKMDTTVCSGDSLMLPVLRKLGYWTGNGVYVNILNDPNVVRFIPQDSSKRILKYYVNITNKCTRSEEVKIDVRPSPKRRRASMDSALICGNAPYYLKGKQPGYIWKGEGKIKTQGKTYYFDPSGFGKRKSNLYRSAVNQFGCESLPTTMPYRILNTLKIDAGPSANLCIGNGPVGMGHLCTPDRRR
jgi:hypothetical protein